MENATYFERLRANVERIARHPSFPDSRQAVELCLEDIEGLSLDGRITAEQASSLRKALLGSGSRAA